MNEIDSEEEITVDQDSVFYYVECIFCGTEFAVWNMLKKHPSGLGYSAARSNDIIKIHCPLCGEQIPLVIAKAPEVFLQPSLFEDRITQSEENDTWFDGVKDKE